MGESKFNGSPEIVSLYQAEHQTTCLPSKFVLLSLFLFAFSVLIGHKTANQ